jgi:RNA polymerase sigma factor (sigma-70 family)
MGATVEVAVDRRQTTPRLVGVETDEDLVVGVRAGVDSAFEEIYDRYARGLFAFCMHMLKSREAAEDALQLTLVSAYRAMRDGTSEIVLRPWLYTIARNRCLSEIRARRESEPWTSDLPTRFSDLSDEVQRREDLRDMVDEIRRLPDDQRAALVLFELGDNSHQQIADIIGVRASKVKALVFQAREALARGRLARDHPCAEIRERIATTQGVILPRSMTRAHISRCPSCAGFESETRRQRAALALIIPVPLAVGLKSTVLGAVLHGGALAAGAGAGAGGAAATGAGVTGGGAAAAGAGVTGGGAVAAGGGAAAAGAGVTAGVATAGTGAVVGSGATVAAGAGAGAVATGGLAGISTGAAVVAGGSVATVSGGLTVASVSGGVVAKMLATAAVALGASHVAGSVVPHTPSPLSASPLVVGTTVAGTRSPANPPHFPAAVGPTVTLPGTGQTTSTTSLGGTIGGPPTAPTVSQGGPPPDVPGPNPGNGSTTL